VGSVEHDAGSAGPGAGSVEHDAGSAGPGAGSVEHDAGPAGPGVGSAERKAGSAQRDAGSAEPGAGGDGSGGPGAGGDAARSAGWPQVPRLPEGAVGGSFLVPYSFKRLDAFDGYQSGMPSPAYYQRLWEAGPVRAADDLVAAVAGRLRERRQRVLTVDLIAVRASAEGLALVRGHRHPSRTDVLDGLAAALVHDALDEPLPWATRGRLRAGTHPAVVEMVAALSGARVGRLHRATPLPPLVHDV